MNRLGERRDCDVRSPQCSHVIGTGHADTQAGGRAGEVVLVRDAGTVGHEGVDEALDRYDLRPSAWIEPQGNWGKGKVTLMEIPINESQEMRLINAPALLENIK